MNYKGICLVGLRVLTLYSSELKLSQFIVSTLGVCLLL